MTTRGDTNDAKDRAIAPSVWNIANLLTTLRLLLVPVFIAELIASDARRTGWLLAAALTFGVAASTDYYDGALARSRNLITSFGKLADPIADKALTGSALVGLSAFGWVSWWITAVIGVREIGVTLLRLWVVKRGVIAASKGGKAKTALQLLAIGWYLWPWRACGDWLNHITGWGFLDDWGDAVARVAPVLMFAALVATVVTGVDYVLRAVRLVRNGAG